MLSPGECGNNHVESVLFDYQSFLKYLLLVKGKGGFMRLTEKNIVHCQGQVARHHRRPV